MCIFVKRVKTLLIGTFGNLLLLKVNKSILGSNFPLMSYEKCMNDIEDNHTMPIIDPVLEKFPYCIVWTPIPCITWFLPFIGERVSVLGAAGGAELTYFIHRPYRNWRQ